MRGFHFEGRQHSRFAFRQGKLFQIKFSGFFQVGDGFLDGLALRRRAGLWIVGD